MLNKPKRGQADGNNLEPGLLKLTGKIKRMSSLQSLCACSLCTCNGTSLKLLSSNTAIGLAHRELCLLQNVPKKYSGGGLAYSGHNTIAVELLEYLKLTNLNVAWVLMKNVKR